MISHYEQELRGNHRKEYFLLLWKINHFVSGVHIQLMHLYLLFIVDFLNSLI